MKMVLALVLTSIANIIAILAANLALASTMATPTVAPIVAVVIYRCDSADASRSSSSFLIAAKQSTSNQHGALEVTTGSFVINSQNRVWVNAAFTSVTGEVVRHRMAFNEGTTGISSMVSNCNTAADVGKLGIDIRIQ